MELGPGKVLAVVGSPSDVVDVIRRMLAQDESEKQQRQLEQNFNSFSADISGGGSSGQQFGQCCENMQQQQLAEPNVINFTAAIVDCAKKSSGQQHEGQQFGEPNVINFPAAISECEKQCSGHLQQQQLVKPNVTLFTAAISD